MRPLGGKRGMRPCVASTHLSVTREFIKQLTKARAAPATVVRTYASVRHFARWIHNQVQP